MEKGNMPRANQPNTPLLRSSSHAGTGIYAKHETIITMSDNTPPTASPPGERGNGHDAGSSSPIITVISAPRITINKAAINNNTTFRNSTSGDSHVRHLCRPKAFRQLSNSSSLLSEIFRHPDTSEDLLRKKIKRANELDASRDLYDFLRNKTPPPENYMSSSDLLKGGEPLARKKKGVLGFLGRKLRRGKKGRQTSSAASATPPIRLPDSAISGRTIDGHRHIAISIPLEHANIDGIVDHPKPPVEPLREEPVPAEPAPEETVPAEPVPTESLHADPSPVEPLPVEPLPVNQPQPKDTKEVPITVRRKPLGKNQVPPVVGVRSSSTGAATSTTKIVPPPPHIASPPMVDPDETIVVPPTSSPRIAATQHCRNVKGGTEGLPAVVGGRSLVGCPHRELTAPRVAVAGVVVPLSGVFSPPPPRALHRSPPLRQLYRISNAGSEDTISGSATSGATTYNSEAESDASSAGATVGPSVIPEIKGQQNTIAEAESICVPAEKRSYRDWCGNIQLPTPPGEPEEALSDPEPEENDGFVTAQPSPSFENSDDTPWATPFEDSTMIDFPPCGSSTPKLRPVASPLADDAPSTSLDNNAPNPQAKDIHRRRMPRSESHVKLMEKYQRLQMLRARELEILLGKVKALEGRAEVGARRGHVTVHALEPENYTTAAKPISGGVAVLCERGDSHDEGCGDYEELCSVAFRESASEDGDDGSTLPENLDSDYEESSSSFHSNPSSVDDRSRARGSTTHLPSLDTGSDTITPDHHHTTRRHAHNDNPDDAVARGRLPSRRGFPHPPTVFPATNTMYSAPLPPPAQSDDSFETFFERLEEAKRKAMASMARFSADCSHREDEYYGLGGRGDGLETVEPVMRWLIETSGCAGGGGTGEGEGEECEMF